MTIKMEEEIEKLRLKIMLGQLKAEKSTLEMTLKNLTDAAQDADASKRKMYSEFFLYPFVMGLLFFAVASGMLFAAVQWLQQ